MKSGPQIAMAVAVGYVLGRSRKMKLAITAAGMMAGRRFTDPKEMLAMGGKLVRASPALQKLTGDARERLLEAAKSAAIAAVNNKIETLGDNLTKRAAGLREPVGELGERASDVGRGAEDLGRRAMRRTKGSEETAEAESTEEPAEAEEGEEERATKPPRGRQRQRISERTSSGRAGSRTGAGSSRSGSAARKQEEPATTSRSSQRDEASTSTKSSGGSGGQAGNRRRSTTLGQRKQPTSPKPRSSTTEKKL
ncbi:hypothetical protein SAMN05421805_12849 [Saccharopolyspora antimicrobica]|uniref:Uncharacterized protein n=2 Tax=Saccharopolyspora antimicrobica TaxID=455193 RepID=A0A1I5KWX3_9PSEU|nr:hypothetical protein ATL45_7545 [Saccharopolyspora antimicrobica]SFO89555.1 hypothetical protein SAMN05421805_12849 [Saccharopolyspora antimicrobica]